MSHAYLEIGLGLRDIGVLLDLLDEVNRLEDTRARARDPHTERRERKKGRVRGPSNRDLHGHDAFEHT